MSELIKIKLGVAVTLMVQLIALVWFAAQLEAKTQRALEIAIEVRQVATITREEQLRRTNVIQKMEWLENQIDILRQQK